MLKNYLGRMMYGSLLALALLIAGLPLPSATAASLTTDDQLPTIIQRVETITALRDLVGSPSIKAVQVMGYYTVNDGGGGPVRQWDVASTCTDDGGACIDPAAAGAGRWVFNVNVADIRWFGAKGDDVSDDSACFLAAARWLNVGKRTLDISPGNYICNATFPLRVNAVSIRGAGVDVSTIRRTDGSFGDTFLIARDDPTTTHISGISISNLTIYSAVDMTNGAVLHIKSGHRIFVNNVFLRNYFKGIHTEGVRDSHFDNIEMVTGEYYTVARTGAYHTYIGNPTDPTKESTETVFSNFNWTTAGHAGDVNAALRIEGTVDGIWFNTGHMFGGNTAGCILAGDGAAALQGVTFNHVWFDQFTPRNLVIQGTTTDPTKFRLISFKQCRFFGGSTNCIAIAKASGIKDVTFTGCEIGITAGNGVQVGSGDISFISCSFKMLNLTSAAASYAIQTTADASTRTVLTVTGCDFAMSNLAYGIQCAQTASTYHLHNNVFRDQNAFVREEISFNAATLLGSCSGNRTGRITAGDVTAAASVRNINIATNAINLIGTTANIATLEPKWHGRRVTLKASTAAQNMVSGGNVRNKLNAARVTIGGADLAVYEYRGDSLRWHEL